MGFNAGISEYGIQCRYFRVKRPHSRGWDKSMSATPELATSELDSGWELFPHDADIGPVA